MEILMKFDSLYYISKIILHIDSNIRFPFSLSSIFVLFNTVNISCMWLLKYKLMI